MDIDVPESLIPEEQIAQMVAERAPEFVHVDGALPGSPVLAPADPLTGIALHLSLVFVAVPCSLFLDSLPWFLGSFPCFFGFSPLPFDSSPCLCRIVRAFHCSPVGLQFPNCLSRVASEQVRFVLVKLPVTCCQTSCHVLPVNKSSSCLSHTCLL